jgi:AcrR family transcriptional regulator
MMSPRDGSRAPQQARSSWTRERLLDVLCDLLSERSLADIRVTDIAARAGVTVGAIYGRFDGKSDMVAAAFERHSDDAVKRMESWTRDSRWEHATPRQIAASWLEGATAFTGRRLPLARISASTDDPRIIDADQRILACSVTSLAFLLGRQAPAETAAGLERKLAFAVVTCRIMMMHRPLVPLEGPLGFDDRQFTERLIDLIIATLAPAPESQSWSQG